ncbi:MAG: hypothetical protein JWQ79_1614 [Mucilaginibacter sp.]|nr:hypothetical protein [Mucilaginibacter sp.]
MRFFINRPELKKILLFIAAILIVFILWARGYLMTLNYEFSGKVEKIEYPDSLKHIPTITVKGEKYDLIYCDWVNYRDSLSISNAYYRDSLSVGDSVIKKKGSVTLYFLKKIN